MATSNDAFLWYNVGDWNRFGLAVPNWGSRKNSQNDTIRYLTDVIARNLAGIMWHPDAKLRTPPSINTLVRIHTLCTRARSIMSGRAVAPGTLNMEPVHALPAAEEFLVFPVPYFTVRNQWLKQYCGLTLLALTEAMQHTENSKPLEISTVFAGQIGQYIQRIYRLMSVELFKIPLEEASKADFTLSPEQLGSYDPTKWFTSTEMIDQSASPEDQPTEDDLVVLTNGIAISQLPLLSRWPSSPASTSSSSGTAAVTGESFVAAPGSAQIATPSA